MCPLGLFIQLHWLLFCFIAIIIRQWLLKLKCMQINWLVSIWRQHWKNCFSFTAVVKKSDEIIWNVFSQDQSLYDFCAHSQNFLKSRWNQRKKKKQVNFECYFENILWFNGSRCLVHYRVFSFIMANKKNLLN